MTADNHPEPFAEGLGHGAQRTAQLIALATMTANGVRQFAKQRHDMRAARDGRARETAEQELKTALDQARSRWAPAHDRNWLRRATLLETARAWGAAVPYAEHDTAARSAMRKCEQRLRDLHPHGMGHYDRLRASGHVPQEAMREAAPFFSRDPNVRTGEPSARDALRKGTGTEWAATEHGPGRTEWEEHRQERRARQILGEVTEKLQAGSLHDVRPDELRTVLAMTTNLPEHIIDKATRPRTGPKSPWEVAQESFPLTIGEAMHLTAQRPREQASPRTPLNPTMERSRRPGR
ncbi:hypothetical protein ACRYCC_27075 [Actinomadura scrupuli]|uniref:hypothetical protein n=1 Tax=Actinomadura scrupuli TaxID=559629 RepID=UPI003D96E77F